MNGYNGPRNWLIVGRRPAAKVKSDAAVSRLVLPEVECFLVGFMCPGWSVLDKSIWPRQGLNVICSCYNRKMLGLVSWVGMDSQGNYTFYGKWTSEIFLILGLNPISSRTVRTPGTVV